MQFDKLAVMFCYICPVYGQYAYARAAVESFLTRTPDSVAVVVDDAHAGFYEFCDPSWRVIYHRFQRHAGLTRSWNYGLILAREMKAEYTICSNDDVLFAPNWYEGPAALLQDPSVGLVGPVTNAPGRSNRRQGIWKYVDDYTLSDTPEALADIATRLSRKYAIRDSLSVRTLNGFCLMGRTKRWWEAAYDAHHVFNPSRRFALIRSEREIQSRIRGSRWRNVVSLRSFVFHYRSVTRGDEFKHGMWFRRT